MSRVPGTMAVVLSSPVAFDPAPAARVLAEIEKSPFLDVVSQLRHGWGILRENLEPSEAARRVEGLGAAGIQAVSIPSERLVAPRSPNEIKNFSTATDSFSFGILGRAEKKTVAWPYLDVVAVGALRSSSSRTVREKQGPSAGAKIAAMGITLATGIPIPLGKSKIVEKKVESIDFGFVLDLFLRGSHLRLRVDLANINYSFFGEKKSYVQQENFRALLHEFVARAPRALLNKGAQGVLDGKLASSIGYENEGELDRECRWLLTLASLSS